MENSNDLMMAVATAILQCDEFIDTEIKRADAFIDRPVTITGVFPIDSEYRYSVLVALKKVGDENQELMLIRGHSGKQVSSWSFPCNRVLRKLENGMLYWERLLGSEVEIGL